jgi:hypothetical protein
VPWLPLDQIRAEDGLGCYACMFINHADQVFGSDLLNAETDEEAVCRARTIYRNGIGKGFEIWRGDALIHAHVHGGPELT